jgi:hypothetical protein
MKSKTPLVLLAVFLALLAVVLFLKPRVKEESGLKLVDLKPEDVQKVSLVRGSEAMTFERDAKGDWTITQPLAAPADSFEVNRLAEDFAGLKIEKVVEEQAKDTAQFGLPGAKVSLWVKGQEKPVVLDIGSENPLDNTVYAQRQGDPRVVLVPSLIKTTLDKKLIDFRQKEVFRFETAEVATIALESKDVRWMAVRREGDWFLEAPLAGLARKSQIDALLNSLSGLRAKDFASEQKTPAVLKQFGLDRPEFQVSLSLPKAGQTDVFLVRKMDDKVYVTTSLSDKVVVAEDQLLTDLEKKPEDLREKLVLPFSSWLADRLEVHRGGLSLAVARDKSGKWSFLSGAAGAADESKVESFIRQVGAVEAASFIDKPGPLSQYGLDKPQAWVKVETSEDGGPKKEFSLQVGSEDKAAGQVVVRNPRFEYLFRVASSFLDDFPKSAQDWKKTEPKDKAP